MEIFLHVTHGYGEFRRFFEKKKFLINSTGKNPSINNILLRYMYIIIRIYTYSRIRIIGSSWYGVRIAITIHPGANSTGGHLAPFIEFFEQLIE